MVSRRNAREPSSIQASGKGGRVTIAGKPGDDLAPGTWSSILKQAGLKE
jgi:predicted RNA binding protein YcfA (HicA-like mRNA interferase family)